MDMGMSPPNPTPLPDPNRGPALATINGAAVAINTRDCTAYASFFAPGAVLENPIGNPVATTPEQIKSWCEQLSAIAVEGTFEIELVSVVPAGINWRRLLAMSYYKATLKPNDAGSGCRLRNPNYTEYQLNEQFQITNIGTFVGLEDPMVLYENPTNPQCLDSLNDLIIITPTSN
eukprot:c1256_g1_i1.p1 GENE.c1256_g1_i1~~c1256_g1_i1.p1  ORF type:complete len:199 (+),score=26.88 c1256_g1_i1:74-598(+)